MSASVLITAGLLAVIAYAMAIGVLRTLAHRIGSQVRRHDMIVEARQRRAAYLQSVNERQKAASASVEVIG